MRGFRDNIPPYSYAIEHVRKIFEKQSKKYGFDFIDLPLVEEAELYFRTSGESSDVCNKELFQVSKFGADIADAGNWCLRPEGTASCMRAIKEHHFLQQQKFARFAYFGQMFRYNRPQKGRYRQFLQAGWEIIGPNGPEIDCEIIIAATELIKEFELQIILEINSIGNAEDRKKYRAILQKHFNITDNTDPLKILDKAETFENVPQMKLNDTDAKNFDKLCQMLTDANVQFVHNPYLVRGLDYYNSTVFEIKLHAQAAQTTILAGGRYDGLMEQIGGQHTPAFGFAAGVDRIADYINCNFENNKIAVAALDSPDYAIAVANKIRSEYEHGCIVFWNLDLKKALSEANKQKYKYFVICGDREKADKTFVLKNLDAKTETICKLDEPFLRYI